MKFKKFELVKIYFKNIPLPLPVPRFLTEKANLLHGIVVVLLWNKDFNKYLIPTRHNKHYDCGVGGHESFFLSTKNNAIKEVMEECLFHREIVRLPKKDPRYEELNKTFSKLGSYNYKRKKGHYHHVSICKVDVTCLGDFTVQEAEYISQQYLSIKDIENLLSTNTPMGRFRRVWEYVLSDECDF
jgi:hypothetical protein